MGWCSVSGMSGSSKERLHIHMELHLKSGGVVRVTVSEYTFKEDSVTGQLAKLTWTSDADTRRKLDYLNLGEVVAVVAEWEELD